MIDYLTKLVVITADRGPYAFMHMMAMNNTL